MRGHAPAEVCFDMGPDPERTLQDVLALLHAHTGHDFRHYRRATLLRRLERRLQVRGRPDLPSYHALQRQDPSESQALLKDLLIGVTQFFRDRAAFAVLVQPQVVANSLAAQLPATTVTQSETRVAFPVPPAGTMAYLEYSNDQGDVYQVGYDGGAGRFFSDRRRSGRTDFSDKFAKAVDTAPRN